MFAPETNVVTTTSSRLVTNAKSTEETSEVLTVGSVTLKNAPTGEEPMLIAASSRFSLTLAKPESIVTNTIGMPRSVCARTSPGMLLVRPIGANVV